MNITMQEFAEIADNAIKENKDELLQVFGKIIDSAVSTMKQKGLSDKEYTNVEKTAWQDTWEWIFLRQRMGQTIEHSFTLDMAFYEPLK